MQSCSMRLNIHYLCQIVLILMRLVQSDLELHNFLRMYKIKKYIFKKLHMEIQNFSEPKVLMFFFFIILQNIANKDG